MRHVRNPSDDLSAPSKALGTACAPELTREAAFADSALTAFVDEASNTWSAEVILVGISFGAQRLRSVETSADLRLLISPYVTGTSLAEDSSQRWQASLGAVGNEGRKLIEQARATLPTQVPNRSVPFTSVDLDAATLAMAYSPEKNRSWFVQGLRSLKESGSNTRRRFVDRLGMAADYIEGRYGRDETYPGLISYLGNFCAQYQQSSMPATSLSRSGLFLSRLLTACSYFEWPDPVASSESSRSDQTCVIFSTGDPITNGAELVSSQSLRNAITLQSAASGHANSKDLGRALKVLQQALRRSSKPETVCR
jgi:hypothetical protein